jgi:hypothetical protein
LDLLTTNNNEQHLFGVSLPLGSSILADSPGAESSALGA